MILLLHGNVGLGPPYGDQIHGFAKDLAGRGYMIAVPQYYEDDDRHLTDKIPHAGAIAAVASRPGADPDLLSLIGFSLTKCRDRLTFIASNPPRTIKVLADFFGWLTPTIQGGVSTFPPTIILHNKNDRIVAIQNSEELDRLLPCTIDHQFVPP